MPQCTSPISHNAPFCNRNVHLYANFCYKIVYCGIFVWCIVGFVQEMQLWRIWVNWVGMLRNWKNHNKTKHNKTMCILYGMYCRWLVGRNVCEHSGWRSFLTHWGRDKMDAILQTTFLDYFLLWKLLYFYSNSTQIYSQRFYQQYASIGSGNGLMSKRWQAIVWTNAGLVYWCVYAPLGLNELNGQIN